MNPNPTSHDDRLFRWSLAQTSTEERLKREENIRRTPYHVLADHGWRVAAYHYHFGTAPDARQVLRQSLEDSSEYFFGNWRLTRPVVPLEDSEGRRPLANEREAREFTWNPGDFKQPLAAALALGDQETASRLARYLLAERIESDHTGGDMVEFWPDAIDVYEAYAQLSLGEPVRLTPATPFRQKVPHKRIQLMRECVFAAVDGDAARCLSALQALVKYVRTREIEKGDAYPAWLSTDATMAYHLMVRRWARMLDLMRDDLYHVMVLKNH